MNNNFYAPLPSAYSVPTVSQPFIEKGPDPDSALHPVFITVPHSGRYYPMDLVRNTVLSLSDLRQGEDAFVDILLEKLSSTTTSLLVATHARSYLDLNRKAEEIDPDMFSPKPTHVTSISSHRVRAGLGCIPRSLGPGKDIYDKPLPVSEIDERLSRAYFPFHHRIKQHLEARKAKFGYAVLIDCHSMPAPPVKRPRFKPWPEVVLGDCWGSSCNSSLTQNAESALLRQNISVRRNVPYAGGFICQHYGEPEKQVHTLQIEINRSLYMDEQTLEPVPHFSDISRRLCDALEELIHTTLPLQAAAE